ncbi:hypothetical protein GQ55_6G188200 [Panicum hallii var. hallii]|uniref:Uncharacterized protein n=1 Tax=Panicum hallii var. hallii TaxID=1504633 RepID=A0A2T7D7D2_9POAL|nr:hypothetical protein GQ55_6G188200 [Panicum hallii var. hallii]PUZ51454.1 hypothetical protein GQ55_6G188200 [Panicum hallii var. hallii]
MQEPKLLQQEKQLLQHLQQEEIRIRGFASIGGYTSGHQYGSPIVPATEPLKKIAPRKKQVATKSERSLQSNLSNKLKKGFKLLLFRLKPVCFVWP